MQLNYLKFLLLMCLDDMRMDDTTEVAAPTMIPTEVVRY